MTLPLRIDESIGAVGAPDLDGKAARLLFVDDNPNVRGTIMRTMGSWGIPADIVDSGPKAVELSRLAAEEGQPYDAIIMDWIMPELDGLSTTRRLRSELGDAMPPVFLASYEVAPLEGKAQAAGVTGLLAKPLFRSRLREVIEGLFKAAPKAEAAAQEAEERMRGHVLLVEDNDLNREIAIELLELLGDITVDCARDGVEAVEVMREAEPGTYDIIFMDCQMPRMDGITATRNIIQMEKERGVPHTPIVAMTANAFDEDRTATKEAGMDGFVAKPISVRVLGEVLSEHLG